MAKTLTALAIAGILLLASVSFGAEWKAPTFAFDSYSVQLMKLKVPAVVKDEKGRKVTYDKAYVVSLDIDFPKGMDQATRLYIGDYEVPEYGGTPSGIYFKIYDPALLHRLSGKNFMYKFGERPITDLGVKFEPESFAPFKAISEDAFLSSLK